jgi:hypothetical protein
VLDEANGNRPIDKAETKWKGSRMREVFIRSDGLKGMPQFPFLALTAHIRATAFIIVTGTFRCFLKLFSETNSYLSLIPFANCTEVLYLHLLNHLDIRGKKHTSVCEINKNLKQDKGK